MGTSARGSNYNEIQRPGEFKRRLQGSATCFQFETVFNYTLPAWIATSLLSASLCFATGKFNSELVQTLFNIATSTGIRSPPHFSACSLQRLRNFHLCDKIASILAPASGPCNSITSALPHLSKVSFFSKPHIIWSRLRNGEDREFIV